MPLIWMGAAPPHMWSMALWPATRQITVKQTAGGAAIEMSPLSCVFTIAAANQPTVMEMVIVWMDTATVMRAGRVPPVTPWYVSHQPAVPTVSALQVDVPVMLDGEERIAAKSAFQVFTATAAMKHVPALMAASATTFTDAALALLVSEEIPVNKCVLWVSLVRPVLWSVTAITCVPVTHRQEVVTPHCEKRLTSPYTELDTVWLHKCLHPGNERKNLTGSSLI